MALHSRYRLPRALLILAVVLCSTARASHAQGLIMQRLAPPPAPTAASVTGAVDPSLVDALLAKARIDGFLRDSLSRAIKASLASGTATRQSLEAAFLKASLPQADAEYAMSVIAAVTAATDEEGSELLAASGASATTDRLYTNVELLRFRSGWFSLRMVTSIAVSNAVRDSASAQTAAQSREFRLQTAQLLTAVQDGGPFAVHMSADKVKELGASMLWQYSASATLARAGTQQTAGRALIGVSGESRLTISAKRTSEKEPESISFLARAGYRHSGGVLIEGTNLRDVAFGQFVVEGRPRSSKVPIGLSVTGFLPARVRPYGVTFQIFGTAGL